MANDTRLADLNELLRKARSARQMLEPDWYLNVAYYYGQQWIFWNRGRIDRPRLDKWRIQEVDNRILPTATSRVARKVKNRPTFQVTPNSYDEDDLEASELGGLVLDDDWRNLTLQEKLLHALMWAEVCAAGFWKIYWDKTKGSSENYMFQDGQPVLNQNQRPIRVSDAGEFAQMEGYQQQPIAAGDMQIDVLSPFNFYPDPIAEELNECEFTVEEHVRSKEYVKRVYNKEVKEDTQISPGTAESRMFPYITSGEGQGEYRGVTVYELYGKEGSYYGSEGKRCVWVKDELLLEETLENSPYDGCPYVMYSGIKVPGRFWPTCITTQLRGPQTALNKVKSQIRENGLRIGNPSVLQSRYSNVQYTGIPGEKILYDDTTPNSVPSFLQPPEMPVYIQNEIERIETSISEISGIHEVSKATVPSGVTAASAINLLQEADDTRLGPEIQDMERSLGDAGTKILRLRAKYQDDARLLSMAGEDGGWDLRQFRGAMLKENTNVEVQAGSTMPRSKAAKQAAMQEMLGLVLQYGLDIKPRDLRKFLRDYGVGGLEHMFASLSNIEHQIRREHNSFAREEPIDINLWDDHDVHIEGHNEFRMSTQYERLSPDGKVFVDKHVAAHQEQRTEAIQAQMAQQTREQQQMMEMQAAMEAEVNGAKQAQRATK